LVAVDIPSPPLDNGIEKKILVPFFELELFDLLKHLYKLSRHFGLEF
jgi:hypothetical protein